LLMSCSMEACRLRVAFYMSIRGELRGHKCWVDLCLPSWGGAEHDTECKRGGIWLADGSWARWVSMRDPQGSPTMWLQAVGPGLAHIQKQEECSVYHTGSE
jgi:hypothetical protein